MQDEKLKKLHDQLTVTLFDNFNRLFAYGNFSNLHNKYIGPYLKENNPPLYIYMNANYYSIRNLQLGQLYLKQPNEFNDPFDSNIYISHYDVYDWVIRNRGKLTPPQKGMFFSEIYDDNFQEILNVKHFDNDFHEPDELFIKVISDYIRNHYIEFEKIKKMIYVGCFSLDENDPLMWSHYANKHTGFCVKYDISRFPNVIRRYLHPIIYNPEPYQVKNIDFWIEFFFILHKEDSIATTDLNMIGDIVFSSMVKGMSWEDEKEWRITIPAPKLQEHFNGNQCISFDYATEIYLGLRIERTYRDHIIEVATSKGIKVFDSIRAIDRIVYIPCI